MIKKLALSLLVVFGFSNSGSFTIEQEMSLYMQQRGIDEAEYRFHLRNCIAIYKYLEEFHKDESFNESAEYYITIYLMNCGSHTAIMLLDDLRCIDFQFEE